MVEMKSGILLGTFLITTLNPVDDRSSCTISATTTCVPPPNFTSFLFAFSWFLPLNYLWGLIPLYSSNLLFSSIPHHFGGISSITHSSYTSTTHPHVHHLDTVSSLVLLFPLLLKLFSSFGFFPILSHLIGCLVSALFFHTSPSYGVATPLDPSL